MHFQKFLIPAALVLSLCLPAYATETASADGTDSISTELVDNGGIADSGVDDLSLVSVDVYGLSPVTPSDTNGLKSVLLEFIGNYDPVIVEYEYENANGYNSFLREVQPDYVWLCSAAMLALFILSIFKLGGAILCRR